MTRLDKFVCRRHEIARYYNNALKILPITVPWQRPEMYSSYHLYPIRICEHKSKKKQQQIYDELWENGVAANVHYIPVHRQPFYESKGFKAGDFSEAERFHREAISIPMYSGLSQQQQDTVIKVLRNIFAL